MDKAQAKIQRITNNLDNVKMRWRGKDYQVDVYADLKTDCSAHSYGKVQKFFASDDCLYLIRVSGEFRDKNRNVVLVAIPWVEMPTTGGATRLLKLVDTAGTGNVTELSREGGRYRNVQYTALGYQSGVHEQAVWNVQVQPVGWSPAAGLVNELRDEVRDEVLKAAVENT